MTRLWQAALADTALPAYRFSTRRAVPPTQTLRRLAPLLPRAGITRLADVTGLDWIGLPVYQAVRPNSRNLSVSQGKGLTRAQAKVSALMESLESLHAEQVEQPTVRATVGSMRRELAYDPYTLPVVQAPTGAALADPEYDSYAPSVGLPSILSDATPVDWVRATDLHTGGASWVPKQLCELNFCVEERLGVPLFRATSNGLASGNTVAEALVHGLCEVVERDGLWRYRGRHSDPERCVDPATVDSRLARQLIERFTQAGMRMRIVDETGPTGLPCFQVLLTHAESSAWYDGSGCSTSRTTALLRALTEAAQSRLSHIAGSRDDLTRRSYRAALGPQAGDDPAPRRSFRSAPNLPMQPLSTAVRDIVGRIYAVTGMAPLAVDLARPSFGLPVVLVVAPGLRLDPPRRR
jgi:ribosomal protein S12 methylthiotransferase accessory factor